MIDRWQCWLWNPLLRFGTQDWWAKRTYIHSDRAIWYAIVLWDCIATWRVLWLPRDRAGHSLPRPGSNSTGYFGLSLEHRLEEVGQGNPRSNDLQVHCVETTSLLHWSVGLLHQGLLLELKNENQQNISLLKNHLEFRVPIWWMGDG